MNRPTLIYSAVALMLLLPQLSWSATQPIVRVELNKTEVAPGERVDAFVTILVPTWLPKPPVVPSIEVPNLIVRQASESTTPTSQSIRGETWSGVLRSYQLYPMSPGTLSLSPQAVQVTYADPDTRKPITKTLRTKALTLEVSMPPGGDDLNPFIAARSLSLEQQIEGGREALKPGDVITRIITARISGSSPIFIPPLIGDIHSRSLANYPKEPVVEEQVNDSGVSGTRIERVVYVATGGGEAKLPDVTLSWYNLDSDTIESTTVPGLKVEVSGPPASTITRQTSDTAINWRLVALTMALILIMTGLGIWLYRWFKPIVLEFFQARRRNHLASEKYAYNRVLTAIRHKDLGTVITALNAWSKRLPAGDTEIEAQLRAALIKISAERFGRSQRTAQYGAWVEFTDTLRLARKNRLRMKDVTMAPPLPALNPLEHR